MELDGAAGLVWVGQQMGQWAAQGGEPEDFHLAHYDWLHGDGSARQILQASSDSHVRLLLQHLDREAEAPAPSQLTWNGLIHRSLDELLQAVLVDAPEQEHYWCRGWKGSQLERGFDCRPCRSSTYATPGTAWRSMGADFAARAS